MRNFTTCGPSLPQRGLPISASEFARLVKGRRVKPGSWMARCPAHDDRSASLHISEGKGDIVLIHCFAGCPPLAVLRALGLTWSDVYKQGLTPEVWREQVAERLRCEAMKERERSRLQRLAKAKSLMDQVGERMVAMEDEDDKAKWAGLFHQLLELERTLSGEATKAERAGVATRPSKRKPPTGGADVL